MFILKCVSRHICPIISLHGPHLRQLELDGLLFENEIGQIAETCPNLRSLSFQVGRLASSGLPKLKVICVNLSHLLFRLFLMLIYEEFLI